MRQAERTIAIDPCPAKPEGPFSPAMAPMGYNNTIVLPRKRFSTLRGTASPMGHCKFREENRLENVAVMKKKKSFSFKYMM